MKNLKQLAAEKNLFTFEDVPQAWRDSEYKRNFNSEVAPEITLLKELLKDKYEVDSFYKCNIQDAGTEKEIYYIEHEVPFIKRKDSNIVCQLYCQKERYFLYPAHYFYSAHDLDNYDVRHATKDLEQPNRIGVFTVKKNK